MRAAISIITFTLFLLHSATTNVAAYVGRCVQGSHRGHCSRRIYIAGHGFDYLPVVCCGEVPLYYNTCLPRGRATTVNGGLHMQ